MKTKFIIDEEHCKLFIDYEFIVITQLATGMSVNTLSLKRSEFISLIENTTDFIENRETK